MVIDAFRARTSVLLAWVLPDESNASADALAARLESDYAVVPAVWPLEVGNALLVAGRRARIDRGDLGRLLSSIAALPIEVEPVDLARTLDAVAGFAQRHDITSYDAAYVELAKRRGLSLATLDRKLKKVCQAERINVIP